MWLTDLKNWAKKPLVIASVPGLLLVACVAGGLHILLDWQVQSSIRRNAEIKAQTWSQKFFDNVPNAKDLFQDNPGSGADVMRLEASFAMVEILRFELFDHHGHQTYASDTAETEGNEASNQKALQVYQTGKPLFFVYHDDEAEHHNLPNTFVEAYVPAVTPEGERIGTLELYVDVSPLEEALEDAFAQISWLLIIGTTVIWAIPAAAYIRRTRELRNQDQKLLELTRYDQLTGILNRNSVSDILRETFETPGMSNGLGVLFVDVDYFKQANDQYGHACGDLLLKHIAGILKDSTRSGGDIVGRFGGDEFVVLARGITLTDFRKLYGRVMEGAKKPCRHGDKSYVPSLSVGAYLTDADDTEKTALHRADLAVYAAKRRGRGQVVEYSPELEGLFKQEQAKQSA